MTDAMTPDTRMVTDAEAAESSHGSVRRQTWTAEGRGERIVCTHCNEDWPCLATRLLADRERWMALAENDGHSAEQEGWHHWPELRADCAGCKLLKEAHGE